MEVQPTTIIEQIKKPWSGTVPKGSDVALATQFPATASSFAWMIVMADEYPRRPKFFACRLIRLLFKTCASQEIGATGALLVTCVVMTEDAASYSRPVTYYDGQLLPILGLQSQKALTSARKKSVEAGWLHYVAGCKGRAGKYWATIPAHAGSHDDHPTDEGHDNARQMPRQKDIESGVESGTMGNGKGKESGTIGNSKGQPFFPVPIHESIPVPDRRSNIAPASGPRETWLTGPSDKSKEFIGCYPRKSKPAATAKQFDATVAELVGSRGWSDEQATEFLIDRASCFAGKPSGMPPPPGEEENDFRPYAINWLKDGRYDEPETEWNKPNTKGRANASNRPGAGQVYDSKSTEQATGF